MDFQVSNFRTRGGLEVDFILKLEEKKFAIECKASEVVTSSEVNKIQKIDQYYKKIEKMIIYRGKRELKDGNVWILPFPKARAVLGL